MQEVTEQQIEEWTENPVTIEFKRLVLRDRDDALGNMGLNSFHPFEAQKTQELLVGLNGYCDALDTVLECLNGDWSLFEVDEDES